MHKIIALLVFLLSISTFAQSKKLGNWLSDQSNTPYFSYHAELPFQATLPNGKAAVLDDDPYFLLGNYKFKLFTYASGQYEVFSGERAAGRFNHKKNTTAQISIDGMSHELLGVKSLAANPTITKRNFGLGYAEFMYDLDGISIKRQLNVKPSEKINQGSSGVFFAVTIKNNSNKTSKINYTENMAFNYEQLSVKNDKSLTYVSNGEANQDLLKVYTKPKGVEKILQEKYQSSLKDIIDTIVNTLMQAEQDRRDDITCLGIKL